MNIVNTIKRFTIFVSQIVSTIFNSSFHNLYNRGLRFTKLQSAIDFKKTNEDYILLARNYSNFLGNGVFDYYIFWTMKYFIEYYNELDAYHRRFYSVYFTDSRKFHLDIDIKKPISYRFYSLNRITHDLIVFLENFDNSDKMIEFKCNWKKSFYIFWYYKKNKYSIHVLNPNIIIHGLQNIKNVCTYLKLQGHRIQKFVLFGWVLSILFHSILRN